MEKTDTNEPNPGKIMETSFAYAASRVLISGVDLEVFTHIANGNHTAAEIAKAAKASQRGIEILLNSLAALNFITKSDGTYDLTPLSEKFLVKGTPAYYGDFVLHIDSLWEPWGDLTKVVKTGKPFQKVDKEQGVEFFQNLVSQLFPMSYPCAKAASEILGVGDTWKGLSVLDVAAGSGAWSIAFAQSDPDTKVTAQDYPGVLEVTKKFVDKFKLSRRFSYLPGDLREVDFGYDRYDLIILGHICHSEGAEKTRILLSRALGALKDGGKLLIADMIPDDERATSVFPLLFAVNMLVNTTEGNTFTMAEYREWLTDAGFCDITTIDVPGPSPLILAKK
ncbi:Ubiquinone/menaquinone biosynthesis C-methyltransferase UbiE [uncultured archaeon]|nr:Ubiquinone/menaquinone biosynthesis C-methyltransferase UbiE [uncultured archaeon]